MGGGISANNHHHPNQSSRRLTGRVIHIHRKPYEFGPRLGAGAFGVVHSAKGPHGSQVAIKVIDISGLGEPGRNLISSYLNEVEQLNRLHRESRHVVRIHDFDFDARSGRAYIVMELGGENLDKLIRRLHATNNGQHPFINPTIRKEIWRQLVSIAATLHSHNIVHMDLKPDNIILFGRTLKIGDLGISKKADVLGYAGVGTPYFSAPEIMEDRSGVGGFYGPKADIWSLGAILYLMTYGQPPSYHLRAAEPPNGHSPSHDPALVDILHLALVPNPHARANITTLQHHQYTKH